jgi:anhydro-N-acetylmuramic acid kinase
MYTATYNIIGVMSGTSLDGVDLAHLHFTLKEGKWSYTILESETVPYSDEWVTQLKSAVGFSETQLVTLNDDYTVLLGTIIKNFITTNAILNIDAVCSHGHTILHQPQQGFTLQIGNLPELARLISEKVVCDFRVQDVALGGQGAPLVPIGDRLLFSDYDFCLNLGGFSNISFEEGNNRIAFDISPVNTVLNFYANQLGFAYDDKGSIARSGTIHQELLTALNALEYYKKSYPKSLGFEFVKEIVLPLMENYTISTADKMHTFSEHIALQIGLALDDFVVTASRPKKMLVTGGGAYNDFILERVGYYLPNMEIIVPDAKTLEFKEALIFGLLGVLKLRGEVNVLSSVTGARENHSSGVIFTE